MSDEQQRFGDGQDDYLKGAQKAAEAAKTNGSGPRAAPMDPPTEREEPPDVGL